MNDSVAELAVAVVGLKDTVTVQLPLAGIADWQVVLPIEISELVAEKVAPERYSG